MKFKAFLESKGISESDFATKSAEEIAKLQGEWNDAQASEVNGKFDKTATKEELEKLIDTVKTQSDTIEELQGQVKKKVVSEKTIVEQIKENVDTLKAIAKKESSKEIVLKANTVRANIANNAQTMELDSIGQLAHRKLTAYDLFRKLPVSESNNNGVITYYDWDQATIVRAAAMVAEGAAFPESTAAWEKGTVTLKKIGDTLPVSEEFFEDEAMFAAELDMFLDTNVKIKREDQVVNGSGVGENITGIVASVDAYTPVASGISDASIFDLIVKLKEDITATGGSKYMPDFALMNISDINLMKLKKDANDNYVTPPFSNDRGQNVDGIRIVECNSIAANTMVLGDSRFARIYEKSGITLSRGFVNAQFTEDMETLKVRTRLAFLIRGADKGGFTKVTSISAALTTLATP